MKVSVGPLAADDASLREQTVTAKIPYRGPTGGTVELVLFGVDPSEKAEDEIEDDCDG
jgi:hypothetical protein